MCGSDGRLYASECLMRAESCRQQRPVIAVSVDNCEGTAIVPANYTKLIMSEQNCHVHSILCVSTQSVQIYADSTGKLALDDITLWANRCTNFHGNTISLEL